MASAQLVQCIVCNQQVSSRQHGLQCDQCNRWQHRICNSGIDIATYRRAVSGLIELDWKCTDCSVEVQYDETYIDPEIEIESSSDMEVDIEEEEEEADVSFDILTYGK